MEVTCALLCDAATVREGLLHVLGGGITRVNRVEYPAALGLTLALEFDFFPAEVDQQFELTIAVDTNGGDRLAEASFTFAVPTGDNMFAGEHYHVPLSVPLAQVVLPTVGAYWVEVFVDGTHRKRIEFWATLVPAPAAE
jgi:hypothetical protein